ncbi:MAG: hypothetical protein R8L53_08915 [Mariprofundales bacterium]
MKWHKLIARAEYLDVRRKMMQAWSDCLDALRDGKDISVISSTWIYP